MPCPEHIPLSKNSFKRKNSKVYYLSIKIPEISKVKSKEREVDVIPIFVESVFKQMQGSIGLERLVEGVHLLHLCRLVPRVLSKEVEKSIKVDTYQNKVNITKNKIK